MTVPKKVAIITGGGKGIGAEIGLFTYPSKISQIKRLFKQQLFSELVAY